MRRILSFLMLALVAALGVAESARADGLYVGHGRRSPKVATWSARVNLAGGFHGASDPYRSGYYYHPYHWYDFGGYGSVGLELQTGYGNSVELYGMYRSVGSSDQYYYRPYGNPSRVASRFDVDAYSFGATLRHYETHGRGGAYVGLGGGFVHSKGRLLEIVDGVKTIDFNGSDDGGEIHGLVGFEGRFAPSVMFGLEMGYRYAFLNDPQDFSGAILGLRLSFLMGS